MTERRPPGMGFETWIDKQIREAAERWREDRPQTTRLTSQRRPAEPG